MKPFAHICTNKLLYVTPEMASGSLDEGLRLILESVAACQILPQAPAPLWFVQHLFTKMPRFDWPPLSRPLVVLTPASTESSAS
jgi:hypothetical protein